MLTKILIAVAIVLVVFLIAVALQPNHFRVERSIVVAAPAAVPFGYVNDLQKWNAINPWAKLDPAMKSTYGGPPSGVGASHAWAGNGEVGEGMMTIIDSRPSDLIRMRLDFKKPFASTATAEYIFRSQGAATEVCWSMSGAKNFISKAFGLVMNVDKMIGDQFEKGLADLKAISEAGAGK
ncbi:MAG: SRPBCC family protein [Opitutaceae bacterium]|nr:SRPBCC family protein [Opitutaceae bacterium]